MDPVRAAGCRLSLAGLGRAGSGGSLYLGDWAAKLCICGDHSVQEALICFPPPRAAADKIL